MHSSIKKLNVEMEMDGDKPTGRTILVIEVDAIIDPQSPQYDKATIRDIVQSGKVIWERSNPPEDTCRLVRQSRMEV